MLNYISRKQFNKEGSIPKRQTYRKAGAQSYGPEVFNYGSRAAEERTERNTCHILLV